uniref:Uncharacterized protein n=1 Tax=Rhizobium rhizogenes TaxID=359 RepID=A0A7S4ZSZ6_RHIRH|nr:hypothetical protein C6.5e_744 [Rhizobium rhizogenes]
MSLIAPPALYSPIKRAFASGAGGYRRYPLPQAIVILCRWLSISPLYRKGP